VERDAGTTYLGKDTTFGMAHVYASLWGGSPGNPELAFLKPLQHTSRSMRRKRKPTEYRGGDRQLVRVQELWNSVAVKYSDSESLITSCGKICQCHVCRTVFQFKVIVCYVQNLPAVTK
jgi:hypothetical protein